VFVRGVGRATAVGCSRWATPVGCSSGGVLVESLAMGFA
jgi:hypothetical protein